MENYLSLSDYLSNFTCLNMSGALAVAVTTLPHLLILAMTKSKYVLKNTVKPDCYSQTLWPSLLLTEVQAEQQNKFCGYKKWGNSLVQLHGVKMNETEKSRQYCSKQLHQEPECGWPSQIKKEQGRGKLRLELNLLHICKYKI